MNKSFKFKFIITLYKVSKITNFIFSDVILYYYGNSWLSCLTWTMNVMNVKTFGEGSWDRWWMLNVRMNVIIIVKSEMEAMNYHSSTYLSIVCKQTNNCYYFKVTLEPYFQAIQILALCLAATWVPTRGFSIFTRTATTCKTARRWIKILFKQNQNVPYNKLA
jgi:hypothetical protein